MSFHIATTYADVCEILQGDVSGYLLIVKPPPPDAEVGGVTDKELARNAAQQATVDAKIRAQRSVLHTSLAEDRPRQERLLDEMSTNSATLQINRALLEYADGEGAAGASPKAKAARDEVPAWLPVGDFSAVVRKLERFGPLPEEDRALLDKLVATKREVPAKTDLIREGQAPSHVHVVTSGLACRYKDLANGKHQIVAFLVAGDFCDLHASILDTMDHSIATLAPSLIAEVPRETILELLDRPSLARAMLRAALVDAATLREWVANIGQRNAEERIAHLFCELHARLTAVGLITGDTFSLPISQDELRCAVGLSLVHTNKSIKKLKEKGLVTFGLKEVAILDLPGLRALCGFTPNYLHLG